MILAIDILGKRSEKSKPRTPTQVIIISVSKLAKPELLKFSGKLEAWVKNDKPKTLAELTNVFAQKSFAVIFLLLMSIPALPIPTGGITHIFEIITMLLALELIVGRQSVWLPDKWKNKQLGEIITGKALPFITRRIKTFEKFSRPRMSGWLKNRVMISGLGLIVFGLTLSAFLAPPFSGLDTLPALGVVLIALGIILEDIVGAIFGLLVGVAGVAVVIGLGTAIKHLIF